jgi:hypothetical protein
MARYSKNWKTWTDGKAWSADGGRRDSKQWMLFGDVIGE